MRMIFGYSLLALSVFLWLGVFLVPFLDLSKAQIAGAITFLIVSGEGAFYLSIVLLGKKVWQKIKYIFSINKTSTNSTNRVRHD